MSKEPMFNISERAPVWLTGFLIFMHTLVSFAPDRFANQILNWGVLAPLEITGRNMNGHIMSLLGHGLLHADWMHVLMNSGMMVAFGVVTIRGIKLWALSKGRHSNGETLFLLIFILGVAGGGVAQWAWWFFSQNTGFAIGASGGASALFATAAWAMGGKDRLLAFGVGWMFINLVMVLAEPILGVKLAWAAHLGGYLAGAILAPLIVRPNSTGFSISR